MRYEHRPLWLSPDMAVLTLIGRLFRMGKLELRTTELLDSKKAFELMKNSRQHGGIRVRLQEQFDTAKVNALKKFHQEFFDRLNDGTDARSVGEDTQKAIAEEVRGLANLLNQASNYSFLLSLQPLADSLSKLAGGAEKGQPLMFGVLYKGLKSRVALDVGVVTLFLETRCCPDSARYYGTY